jgi:hypothetical protein
MCSFIAAAINPFHLVQQLHLQLLNHSVLLGSLLRRRQSPKRPLRFAETSSGSGCKKKTHLFFECFPYVCPEHVLVK